MGTSWPQERIKEQLAQGKEAANQLKLLSQEPFTGSEFLVLGEDLIARILKSFTESLSALTSHHHSETLCKYQRSEGSTESRKSAAPKDKRGCYKRRKNGETRIVISTSIDDGQAWRKYGQKEILNSRHPRAYFRCTRKYDQGCKAIKQVQRMEGNEQLYKITYIGNHTCKDVLKAPQIITDSDQWKSMNVSSGTNIPFYEQEYHPLNNSAVEDVSNEEIVLMTPKCSSNISSSIDSMVWPQSDLFSVVGSVYSYTDTTTSSHNLDVDAISDFGTAFTWLDNA